jgi:hypothetical protein
MSSEALRQFETEKSPAVMLHDIIRGPGWAPYVTPERAAARILPMTVERISGARFEDIGCVRGLIVGLGLEAVLALGVVGAWQLWHLVR